MKIRYTSSNGRLVFESEVSTPKEAFEWLAGIQELFEEPNCGLCQSGNLQCDVREFDGNAYYKLSCRECGATLDCGQRRDGSNLFIKRKDPDGNPLPHRGWYHYTPAEASRAGNGAGRRSANGSRAERHAAARYGAELPADVPAPF